MSHIAHFITLYDFYSSEKLKMKNKKMYCCSSSCLQHEGPLVSSLFVVRCFFIPWTLHSFSFVVCCVFQQSRNGYLARENQAPIRYWGHTVIWCNRYYKTTAKFLSKQSYQQNSCFVSISIQQVLNIINWKKDTTQTKKHLFNLLVLQSSHVTDWRMPEWELPTTKKWLVISTL